MTFVIVGETAIGCVFIVIIIIIAFAIGYMFLSFGTAPIDACVCLYRYTQMRRIFDRNEPLLMR